MCDVEVLKVLFEMYYKAFVVEFRALYMQLIFKVYTILVGITYSNF